MRFKIKNTPKYQFGGSNLGDESDAFNSIADYAISRQDQPDGPSAPEYDSGEDTEDASDASAPDEEPDTSAIDDLQGKFDELKAKFDDLQAQSGSTGDDMLDFMFADDNSNLPLTFDSPSAPSWAANTESNETSEPSSMPSMLDPFGGKEYKPTEAPSNLGQKISNIESGGHYGATNPHSTATGKYQFLWGKKPGQGWGDSIKAVTGVKDQKQFLNSPDAQEKYYAWYEKNVLAPGIDSLKPFNKKGLTDTQIGQLIHFRGIGGAKQYLLGNLADKQESYNVPISQYIKQNGGIAITPQQQYEGLNNPAHDQMFFPNTGVNTFRGLDNGQPVLLHDQLGRKLILRGKHDTAQVYGNVHEKRLK